MRVRTENGRVREDGWVEIAELPMSVRVREAGKIAAIGIAGGAVFILIPLIHILGVLFALTMIGFAVLRLRGREVVGGAGGVCPACGAVGNFFIGFGRRRYQPPIASSCSACAVALTLTTLI